MTAKLAHFGAVLAVLWGTSGLAQTVPWVEFLDQGSGEVCGIVNTTQAELVVLNDTGELVLVTGPDLVLTGTFVDESGFVFIGGLPAGLLDYADDAFGFPKLWWLGADGTVVDFDPLTFEPFATSSTPDQISGLCGACERWDDPAVCGGSAADTDLDGVSDEFDFCENTPLDEAADVDGCSCSQSDFDGDDIDDCIDLCPDTLPGDPVDDLGCGCSEFDDDNDGVDECIDECLFTPLDEGVDFFGCSCSQVDDDQDGVDECSDQCAGTPLGDDVDDFGCSVTVVVPPPVIIACGNFTALMLGLTYVGLASMRSIGRRRG